MIAIIGRGNVASHLYTAFKGKTETCLVNPHTLEGFPDKPDIIIITVTDDAIEEVCEKLPDPDVLVVHTSGSVSMDCLKAHGNNYGVFYPLQTFTKGVSLKYDEIPVFIEGSDPKNLDRIRKYASLISKDVREADSESRRKLHLASVFACNFTNVLADISAGILNEAGYDLTAVLPLMQQTVDKLKTLTPKEAQTGPAKRGDNEIIRKHVKMLESKPKFQSLYKLMSEIIQDEKL